MKIISCALIVSHFFLFSSCTKDDKCTAGTGGSLTFSIFPEHHGEPIYSLGHYNDSIMIKFETQEFPGYNPSSYDLIVTGDSGKQYVNVAGLTCGDYYIFATGFDTAFSKRVYGGRPYSTEATEGTLNVLVSVTE